MNTFLRSVGLSASALLLVHLCSSLAGAELRSPSGALQAEVSIVEGGRLTWTLRRGAAVLMGPSDLGITVGDQDLGLGVTLGRPEVTELDERYPWRGVKWEATNHCRLYRLPVRHVASRTDWQLEAKVFEDGFAYRYVVPGSGSRRVSGEASGWRLPAEAEVWFQTDTASYEGVYRRAGVDAIPQRLTTDRGSQPVHLGPPVTVALSRGGYLLVTEANLVRYSGMTLRPLGDRRLQAVFQDDPDGFNLEGTIVSPWRVTIVADDLNALVNTDVIHNLCDPPDPDLFPEGMRTPWINAGRGLITWCVFGNDGAQWSLQRWFVDSCAALNCEFLLVDGGWQTERWGYLSGGADPWARLAEICDYAAERGVGILVWHAYPEGREDGPGLTDPIRRREFFRRCQAAGVQGVKIDFFNSEKKETIEAYTDLARLAAEHQMTINFHGANKPTGEVRSWPNEISREGIREQEYVLWEPMPLEHYAALPFTRMVVGHADFLPGYVRSKYLRNTTATFQMATAVIATSPFICWPDHPDYYLASPFLGLVQAMPVLWDETVVLPGSEIGRGVVFARRSGLAWFLAILNGEETEREWRVPLTFLGKGAYAATLYQDGTGGLEEVDIEVGRELTQEEILTCRTASGGGFVGWIQPLRRP